MRMRGAAITEEQQAGEEEHIDVSVPPLEVRVAIVALCLQFPTYHRVAWEARLGGCDTSGLR